jgi:hypothetical protein
MIVSDATTPQAFRREVLDEIGRRMAWYEPRIIAATTQRERGACEQTFRELRDLAAFLESINFSA